MALNAGRQFETKSGRRVMTRGNYLVDKPTSKLPPKSE